MRADRLTRTQRRGVVSLELIVAGGLLLVATGTLSLGTVAVMRVKQQQENHTAAADELSNQLEKLLAESASRRAELLGQLAVSSQASQVLRNAEISGAELDDEHGKRVQLELQWLRPGDPPPLVVVGWVDTQAEESTHVSSTEGNESSQEQSDGQ